MLQYTPDNMHLLLLSRIRPPFFHSRFRLTIPRQEIRAKELLFSEEETAELCRQKGLQLSSEGIRLLIERTCGWVHALHLAAEFLRKKAQQEQKAQQQEQKEKEEVFAALQDFRGDSRDFSAFMEGEVFAEWPGEIGTFLLHTSILERQSGPLCDAVTGSAGSEEILENLADDCALVQPLGTDRGWFQYHPLLSEFLHRKLQKEEQQLLPELHRRAGTWYQQQGFLSEAISHFLKCGDHVLAASLMESKAPELLSENGDLFFLLKWSSALPQDLLEGSRILCLSNAWAMLLAGRLEEAQL